MLYFTRGRYGASPRIDQKEKEEWPGIAGLQTSGQADPKANSNQARRKISSKAHPGTGFEANTEAEYTTGHTSP